MSQFNILLEIAKVLSDVADQNPDFQIIKYPYGKINEIVDFYFFFIYISLIFEVYPVNGGSEDWAYAAGWENQISTSEVVTQCQNELNSSTYNLTNIRTMLFLIECDFLKAPPNTAAGWASGLLLKSKKI